MDIDNFETAEVWGSGIDRACDALLSSDCSLVGGLYHVTTGGGNLWGDIDTLLGLGEVYREDPISKKYQEPSLPKLTHTPRKVSVSGYLRGDTPGKTDFPVSTKTGSAKKTAFEEAPPENLTRGTAKRYLTPEPKLVSTQSCPKPGSAKPKVSSAKDRPNTAGHSDVTRTPKFYRLGQYPGTRPYTVSSAFPNSEKTKPMPYFPEILFQVPTKTSAVFQVDKVSEDQALGNNPLSSSLGAPELDITHGLCAVEGKKSKPKPMDSQSKEGITRQQQTKTSDNVQKIKVIRVKPTLALGNDSATADKGGHRDEEISGNPVSKPKGLIRLRSALRRLGHRIRSLFTACSSSRH